jgi:hypothetical protein
MTTFVQEKKFTEAFVRMVYNRRRQPTARVPSVARGTIFNGTLSELKYSNYDLIKIEFLIQ